MDAATWFEAASSCWRDWPLDAVIDAKGGHRIAVIIPARDEAATIGGIVEGIRAELGGPAGLVDELIVIDSDSRDDTAAAAVRAGATAYSAAAIRPDLGTYPGKGEALWKSQFVTAADVLVFVDADLTEWGTHFVTGLLGPLLTNPAMQLVKGFYDRIADDGTGHQTPQGGRVTELVARPLLNLWWPELSRVVQPLAGEWAIRRSTFESLPVPVGYGVEMSTLLDVYARDGLGAIAQVDLGERAHSHQSVHDLGVMAAEILAVAAARADKPSAERRSRSEHDPADVLWQFDRTAAEHWRSRHVPLAERPPGVDT